jgi:LacI family transcriptional regulator
MSITQKQIAESLGVSRRLVGYALDGGGTISEAKRQQIQEMAAQLGYRPHHSARVMRSGRFGGVALTTGGLSGRRYVSEGLLDSVHEALARRDLHLMVAQLPNEQLAQSDFIPKFLRESMVDGLLLDYNIDQNSSTAQRVHQQNTPAIWLNHKEEFDCVHPDDEAAGHEATRHLLQLGHRRVAYTHALNSEHYSARDRRAGYERAMQEAGFEPQIFDFNIDEMSQTGDTGELLQWLRSPQRPTAIVAYEAYHAIPILVAALSCGLQIPRDLSLVGFSHMAINAGFIISTLQIPVVEMGHRAVEMLMQKIENPAVELPTQALAFHWSWGHTLAPPSEQV